MTLASFSNELLTLSDAEFKRIAELIHGKFGIFLSEKKKALVRGRLNKLVKGLGYRNFTEYFDQIENGGSTTDLLDLIDRISTNHSFFFREADHFDFLTKTVLPRLHGEDIRIWSAGGAAGQEAYTIAMVVHEYVSKNPGCLMPSILATDISVSAMEQASSGIYPKAIVSELPFAYRKFVSQIDESHVRINEELRKMILFKRLNLKQEEYPFKGKFNVIFCRNVMIYFDRDTKMDLVSRFAQYTRDGGYLFIGHSETLGRETAGYTYVEPTVYRKWEKQ